MWILSHNKHEDSNNNVTIPNATNQKLNKMQPI